MIKKYKLNVDESAIKSGINRKETEQTRINEALPIVLKFFNNELTDQEIRDLKSYQDILNIFKPDFPHPNAKDELNFELLGKDTRGLKEAAKVLKLINTDYILKGGQVSISSEWFENNIETRTRYTNSENEVKAYEYAKKLAALMKKGNDSGYITKDIRSGINHGIDLFYLNEDGSHEIRYGGIKLAAENASRKQIMDAKANKSA